METICYALQKLHVSKEYGNRININPGMILAYALCIL